MCSITQESKVFHRSRAILDWTPSGANLRFWLGQEGALLVNRDDFARPTDFPRIRLWSVSGWPTNLPESLHQGVT